MKNILVLDNEFLKLTVHADCSGEILNKKTGQLWKMGPVAWQDTSEINEDVVWTRNPRFWCDYFIGRFQAKRDGDDLIVGVFGPPWTELRGTFRARWRLDGEDIKLQITDIDEALPSLNFPPPIVSASLVIPDGVGKWIRKGSPGMECRFMAQNNGLNMRWFGGLADDEKQGWQVIFDENYEHIGCYQNSLLIMPTFLKSKGHWLPSRSVRYCFTNGGYVGLAKRFRQYARERKIFRTLEEKIRENPDLKRMLGGRIVSFFQSCTDHATNAENFYQTPANAGDRLKVNMTHADAKKIVEQAKAWGMKKGLFNLRGTFAGGYDERHPDIWPPEPALGTMDELKGLMNQEGPYLAALHDNYQDIYKQSPSFPDGVIRTRAGHLMWGGHWHGGLTFIICSKEQERYARRNWEHLKTLNPKAHFIDTVSCVRFYECYDPDHPLTMDECRESKMAMMKFFKDQGVVLGSEEAGDFGMYHIDWLENRHTHVPHQSIPLWPLVFHDAAFYARYGTGGTGGGEPVSQLENWLWGYMNYWPAHDLASWPAKEKAFKASLALDDFHARIGMDEMTNHRYLQDGLVEQTEFSSGVSVIANFSNETRTVDGKEIPARGHLVLG
ncbi:MAG: hypothetical protein HOO88_05290 [Kiritimatiellaceae bacterium]|nr:hypothetical protein [Kiritimatiellaceae bacterium]